MLRILRTVVLELGVGLRSQKRVAVMLLRVHRVLRREAGVQVAGERVLKLRLFARRDWAQGLMPGLRLLRELDLRELLLNRRQAHRLRLLLRNLGRLLRRLRWREERLRVVMRQRGEARVRIAHRLAIQQRGRVVRQRRQLGRLLRLNLLHRGAVGKRLQQLLIRLHLLLLLHQQKRLLLLLNGL